MKKALYTIILILLLLSGCKSVQYVPVESHSIEHHYHNDTIREKDSIISEKNTIIREADSAMVANLGLKLKANEKAILILRTELQKAISQKSESKSDTIIKVDSVQVPYPVEKKLTKWEQTKMNAGGVALIMCVLVVLLIIVAFIAKVLRKT